MQKRNWFLMMFAFAIGIFVFPALSVQADSYKISHYHAQVDIQKNGDAVLTQRVTYNFSGSFHGVYYNQELKGNAAVSDLRVAIQAGTQQQVLQQAENGENNTYQATSSKNELKLKIYHTVKNQEVTFIYRYRLHQVITNYRDTAELNWKIVGSKWDTELNDVQLLIQLPATNVEQLQAWTHGNLAGTTTVQKDKGRVLIKLAQNPAGQYIESHLLFPTAVTSQNTNVVDQNAKTRIQKQEAQLAQAANKKRAATKRQTALVRNIVLLVYACLFVGWLVWLARRRGNLRAKLAPIVHSYAVPPFSAEVAQTILKKKAPDSAAFSAYLLELAAAKKIAIKPIKTKKEDYAVELLDKTLLDRYDLLQLLFNDVGDGQQFLLSKLKKFGKGQLAGQKLQAAFSAWQTKVSSQAEELGFKDLENIKVRNYMWAWMIGLSLVAVLAGFLTWGTWAIGGILLSLAAAYVLSFFYVKRRPPYSQTGWRAYYQLLCFQKMLKDIGRFNLKEVGELILWEQILPYAVAFGLADKVIAALKTNFNTAELETGFGIYYPIIIAGNTNFGSAFSTNFTSAVGNYSSATGGTGGFSGGSSGGFGGGSGGGAF